MNWSLLPFTHRPFLLLAALLLAIGACDCGDPEDRPDAGGDTDLPGDAGEDLGPDAEPDAEPDAHHDTGDTSDPDGPEHQWVQDLWIFERVHSMDAQGSLRSLDEEIVAHLQVEVDQAVTIHPGVTFHVVPALDPYLVTPSQPLLEGVLTDEIRDDVDVVAGLLEYDDSFALAALATPDADAETPIGFADELTFDLSFVDDLDPGDTLIFDYAFAQSLPAVAAPDQQAESALQGLELLASRLEDERVQYFGRRAGDLVQVLYYTNQFGVAYAGSTRGGLPAKSGDMLDGMEEGLDDCGFGLRCVAEFFDSFLGGASSSFDQALSNGGLNGSEPEPRRPFCIFNCSRSTGDPNIRTFHGVRYSMMAAGEFVGARNDDIEVQFRAQPWSNFTHITVNTAVAVAFDDHRITVDLDVPRERRVMIDGDPIDVRTFRDAWTSLGPADLIFSGGALQISYGDYLISISDINRRQRLNLYVSIPDGVPSEGLLGTFPGDPDDDFTTRGGQVLEGLPENADLLYDDFVHSWRISQSESLFDYEPDTDTDTFTDLSFPTEYLTLDDLDTAVRAWAEALCETAGITSEDAFHDCVFDVGFTQDVSFARINMANDLADRIADGLVHPAALPVGGDLGDPIHDENLIHNGDAELGPAVPLGESRELPLGWTDLEGEMWISPYGLGAGSDLADADVRGPGENYFWGGQNADAVITQTQDLSNFATLIDTGEVHYVLSGLLGGWEDQNDRAILEAEFFDGDDARLHTARIGPVTDDDRDNETTMRPRSDWGRLPPGTRSVRFTLTAILEEGTNNDGYADELALWLYSPLAD